LPDPSLTASSSSGLVYFGDVPPGNYDITVVAAGLPDCKQHDRPSGRPGGWASSSGAAAARIPAVAGMTTEITIRCTP
jgi:hypothetical protein